MPELPDFQQLLEGSPSFVLAALCVAALFWIRHAAPEAPTRRRALFAALLFVLFALARLPLLALEPTVARLDGGLAANRVHQFFEIFSLLSLLLGIAWTMLLLTFDVFLVGRLKQEIPRILSDVLLIVFLVGATLWVFYSKTELDITGLFTTAGLLSIVIGLALQDTLGNVFAGLSLQLEQPYKVGDWISFALDADGAAVGGAFEGLVIDVSWRSTQFRTRNNDVVTVPNSTISKESFINHSAPSRVSGRIVSVGVHYRHPPAQVKRVLLDCCREVETILDRPPPLVRLANFGDSAITYDVKFWIRDWAATLDIDEAFRTVVWYAFQREGIEIPFPIQTEIQLEPPSPDAQRQEHADHVLESLRHVEFLSPLSADEMRTVAERTKMFEYYTNETICRQDDEGDSFFVLEQGEVVVVVSKNGKQQEVARLSPPSFFGEMALCTGERRNATVRAATPVRLLSVDADAFKSVIIANPALAEQISSLLARRQIELSAKRDALDRALAAGHAESSRQILQRIRKFFGFNSGA